MLQSSRAWSGLFFCLIPGGMAALFLRGMDRGHLQAETWRNLMQQLLPMPMKHIETSAVRMLWGMQQLSVWPGLDVHHNHYCMYDMLVQGCERKLPSVEKKTSVFMSLQVVAWRSVILYASSSSSSSSSSSPSSPSSSSSSSSKSCSIDHQTWTTAAATIIVIVILLLLLIIITIIIMFVLIGSSSSKYMQIPTAAANNNRSSSKLLAKSWVLNMQNCWWRAFETENLKIRIATLKT